MWRETLFVTQLYTNSVRKAMFNSFTQDMIEDTRMFWLRSQMDLNLPSRTILPSKLQNNTRAIGGKKFIALLFSALNCTWKRRPSISVKIFMFFLSLETSTVAFRTVLDELLCFFFALNLTSFWYFFRNLSFLLSCLLFGENLPRKFPRNSREIGRFLREFASSNPAKFHFFSRELSEALFLVEKLILVIYTRYLGTPRVLRWSPGAC